MSTLIKRGHHILTVFLLLLLAAIARVSFTSLDFNSLLSTYLVDDAFYYFKIASHIATDHRITYDGEQLSNGFHPLWMAVITPFYTAGSDGVDFVYRVQWIMFFIDLLSVVVLYRTFLRLGATLFVAVIGTAVFCVHATFIDVQMNGLETSLNTLVLLLLLNAFLPVFQLPPVRWRSALYCGVASALAFLARTDNAIAVLVLFLAWTWQERYQWQKMLPKIVAAGALALLMVSPWLLWNGLHFGSVVQSSGKIETIYWGEPHFSWQRTLFNGLMMPIKVHQQLKLFTRLFIVPWGNAAWVAAGFMVFVGVAITWFCRSRCMPKPLKGLVVFCCGVLAIFIYHAAFRSFVRTWYFVPVGLVFLLLLVGLVVAWQSQKQAANDQPTSTMRLKSWLCVPVLVGYLFAVLFWYSPTKLAGVVTEPVSHLVVAKWLNTHTPADAVIGSMNSGVLSYVVHRKVINLDGVVDVRSMRAHWERREPAYIHERGIRYLVDNDGALQFFCRDNPFHTCVTEFTFGDPKNLSKVVKIVDKPVAP
jgi:hypothetical protein